MISDLFRQRGPQEGDLRLMCCPPFEITSCILCVRMLKSRLYILACKSGRDSATHIHRREKQDKKKFLATPPIVDQARIRHIMTGSPIQPLTSFCSVDNSPLDLNRNRLNEEMSLSSEPSIKTDEHPDPYSAPEVCKALRYFQGMEGAGKVCSLDDVKKHIEEKDGAWYDEEGQPIEQEQALQKVDPKDEIRVIHEGPWLHLLIFTIGELAAVAGVAYIYREAT